MYYNIYYLIVTGKGKSRRILTYVKTRNIAIQILNRAILDYGWLDARLVTSKFQPPENLYHKPLETNNDSN